MIRQLVPMVSLLVFVAANSLAQTNNPVPDPNGQPAPSPAAGAPATATPASTPSTASDGRKDPTQDQGVRKLGRRERKERIAKEKGFTL